MKTVTRMYLLRARAGLSQVRLAEMARLNQADYSRLETGRVKAYPGHLARIASALGIDSAEASSLQEMITVNLVEVSE